MNKRSSIEQEIRYEYLKWLYDWVSGENYWALFRHLHRTPFRWTVPNDDNRAMDGIALRDRFEYEEHYTYVGYAEDECSVLELLVGMASRINDIMIGIEEEDQTPRWFWEIVSNLFLHNFTDDNFFNGGGRDEISDILDMFMDRTYTFNGEGGLFPLKNTDVDQREVELWYQMSAYLDENFDINQVV